MTTSKPEPFQTLRAPDGQLLMLSLAVYGTPAPQGSKRHVGNGVMVESSKKVQPWREAVKATVTSETGGTVLFPAGPLSAKVDFYLTRPRGHFGTGRNAAQLKPAAPAYPAGRPDVDKLLRSTLDGLGEAGVYGDDAQVAVVIARKLYVCDEFPTPGAHVSVLALAAAS